MFIPFAWKTLRNGHLVYAEKRSSSKENGRNLSFLRLKNTQKRHFQKLTLENDHFLGQKTIKNV